MAFSWLASPADTDETDYLRWLADQHRYLHTAGVVPRTTVPLRLDRVFVDLSAERDWRPVDRAPDSFVGPPISALDALRATKHLVVVGDPGSGKTTLLRYLALTHAQARAANTTVDGRPALFPIYLRIRDYARWPHQPTGGVSDFLPDHLHALGCHTPGVGDLLRRRLENGGCLILLDGLDETGSADQHRAVVAGVVSFVAANSRRGNWFVVTSRIRGYLAAPLPEPFWAVRLQDMDNATIEAFLDVYCREREQAENLGLLGDFGQREADAIGQALIGNDAAHRLAGNPMLLTALALVHRTNGQLPPRRIDTYAEVGKALEQTGRSANEVARPALSDERGLAHPAFEDYHAARRLASPCSAHQRATSIRRHLHDPRYDETILLALGLIGAEDSEQVASVVAKAIYPAASNPSPDEDESGRDFLFMFRVLADGIPVPMAFIDAVIDRAVDEWFTPETSRCRFASYRTELAERMAGLAATTAAQRLLVNVAARAAVASTRPSLLCELAAVVARLGPLPESVVTTLVGLAISDDDPSVRLEAVSALATDGSLTGPPIAAAVELATSAEDPVVRTGAVTALAAGLLTDPVLIALGSLATSAADLDVRVRAMWELAAEESLTDPVTAAAVRLATSAEDPVVRAKAVSALALDEMLTGRALTSAVITSAVRLVTTDVEDSDASALALSALTVSGSLTAQAVTALAAVAASAEDWCARTRAMSALTREQGSPSAAATAALAELTGTAADPCVRVAAVSALTAAGRLTDRAIAAAVELATSSPDPAVRSAAVSALTIEAALTDPVITALRGLATSAEHPDVRAWATSELAHEQSFHNG